MHMINYGSQARAQSLRLRVTSHGGYLQISHCSNRDQSEHRLLTCITWVALIVIRLQWPWIASALEAPFHQLHPGASSGVLPALTCQQTCPERMAASQHCLMFVVKSAIVKPGRSEYTTLLTFTESFE